MRVIIAGVGEGKREWYRQTVLGAGLECEAGDCVAHAELSYRILHGPTDLIVLRLEDPCEASLPVLRQTASQTKVPIVAVGATKDAEEILQILRNGAREYVHEADFGEGLLAALGKMRQVGSAPIQWGQILAVIAAKPGVGVTTVATNLAFSLAGVHPRRVVLAELGMQVPELALNLDVNPQHSLTDLAVREDRLDTTLLRQLLVTHYAQLQLLVHQPATLQAVLLEPPLLRKILVLLRTMFEFTVIDLGHSTSPANLAALELADRVVIVVNLDVPTLRLSRRFLRDLDDAGIARDRQVIVANRYGQRNQFPWKQAQEALAHPVQEWIPDNSALINQALNQGQPLATFARRATITRLFDQLASFLTVKERQTTGVAG